MHQDQRIILNLTTSGRKFGYDCRTTYSAPAAAVYRTVGRAGVNLILFLCTGDFPAVFHSKVPLIFPCKVLNGLVPALSNRGKIAVVVPTPQHVDQTEKKWNQYVKESIIIPASPYGSQDDLDAAARAAAKMDVDLVVMDCIGYNIGMKEQFQKLSGKRVILSRTLAVPGYDGTAVIRGIIR